MFKEFDIVQITKSIYDGEDSIAEYIGMEGEVRGKYGSSYSVFVNGTTLDVFPDEMKLVHREQEI